MSDQPIINEPFEGLTAIVQYRGKRSPSIWRTMAAFDTIGPAEIYHAQQRTDAACLWEYRLVDLQPKAGS